MRRIIAWILVLASCFGMLSVTASAASLPFTDVASDAYYADPVAWAVEKGITKGVTETTFAPDDICTRGQVVTFLYRAAGSPKPAETNHNFTDVNEGDYYYNAVLWAVEKGITKGVSDTAFDPNGTCTRGQIVTFLYRHFSAEEAPQPDNRGDTTLVLKESATTVENGGMLRANSYVVVGPDGNVLENVVSFPVTMYNYDQAVIRAATHKLEVEAGDGNLWNGMYFSGGSPDPTAYVPDPNITFDEDGNALIPNGDYLIYSDGNGKYVKNDIDTDNSWGVSSLTATTNTAEATRWTTTMQADGSYTIQDPNGKYMDISGRNASALSDDPVYVSIYKDGQNIFIKKLNASNQYCYLNALGGHNESFFGGWTGGSPITFIVPGDSISRPYAPHNFWNKKSGNNDNGDLIYTGLVQDTLINDQIVFNVPDAGIFNNDPDVKDIYEYVGLPFVVDQNGYYTFDSDINGVYFADTTGDGRSDPQSGKINEPYNMQIDPGMTQGWNNMQDDFGDGSSNLWAPFNTNENDTGEGAIDYHFGMRADIPFSMTANGRVKATDDDSAPIIFSFSGDDDVWVFVDGHLVIDLGGIHNRLDAVIDFAANTITYFEENDYDDNNNTGSFNDPDNFATTQKLFTDSEGEGVIPQTRDAFAQKPDHEIQVFYLERGEGTSNAEIKFNLPMSDAVLITKDATQSWSAAQDDLDGDDGDGTQNLTAREQAAVDNLLFGFTLYKMNEAYLIEERDESGNLVTDANGKSIIIQNPAFTGTPPSPVANTKYIVLDKDGNVIGNGSTDENGRFFLKNGQTAKFITDIPAEGVTYFVQEDQTPEGFLTPDYQYAGKAANGFNYQGMGLVPGTETIQEYTGHVADAAEMGEHELPMAEEGMASQNQSYIITAMGSTQATDTLEFICINYLDEDMPKPSAFANDDTIVLDYGLPVVIDPLANDVFRGENVEIVAWGDETLKLNEVLNGSFAVPDGTTGGTSWTGFAVAYVTTYNGSNANGYSTTPVKMADCLYTFDKNDDGTYEVSATISDGTKVYLNHYTADVNEIPNDSIPGKITVATSTHTNMFKLIAKTMEGGSGRDRTLHFHSGAAYPYWNRCATDTTAECAEYLYRPAHPGETSSTEIPGYILVNDINNIVDGGQYLIVHNKGNDYFVLHPSTSTNKFDHVAKVGTTAFPTVDTAFSFDSGNVTFNDVTYTEPLSADDNITRDTFTYTLNKQLTDVEVISYIIKATAKDSNNNDVCRYSLAKIYIVPATTMYYEENFANLVTFTGSGWLDTKTNATYVSAYQEPGVVGTVGDSTYGSDVAYLNDSGDSNGTSRFGKTNNAAIRFSYTFTGTGTSFFARTSANTGYMQIKLYEGTDTSGQFKDIVYRDTYYKDENGSDADSDGTLYNIPVYTLEDLPYGTYTLVVTVAKAGTLRGGETGNEFYLDGIRIIQPLHKHITGSGENNTPVYDTITDKALDAYATDGEDNMDIVTLRYKLIADNQTGDSNWGFVVFTDTNDKIDSAAEYTSIGPKEEVYLLPGQSVSFSIKYWHQDGYLLHLGMKAPFGNAGAQIGQTTFDLKNAADCYYNITGMQTSVVSATENGKTYYIATYTITATDRILALTNLKVTGNYEFVLAKNVDIHIDGSYGVDSE